MAIDSRTQEILKQKLDAEKARLEKILASFTQKDPAMRGDFDTSFPEMGTSLEESADEVEEYENLLPEEFALETRLAAVTKALDKTEKGSYGLCEQCRCEIDIERLEASPEAAFCLEHQK